MPTLPDRDRTFARLAAVLAALAALAAALSAVEPRWIENLAGFSPDGGSGETEWGLTLVLAVAAALLAGLARFAWRRAAADA